MIPQETVDEIRETARVEEVVGEFVSLKKRGANLLGLCPFHNEKTPSFTVSPVKGFYKCFGCGQAGDSVKFLMEHEHYTYPEALRYLAKKYNIEIEEEEQTAEEIQEANERESLYIVSKFAAEYFKEQLLETDDGRAIGLSYFKERGFRDDIIEKFQLGYNPDRWEALTQAALDQGYKLDYLEKTGLSIVKEDRQFDRFKGRVMFPIHNISGRVIGFGGRTLSSDKKTAKYLNSPESEIYYKSKVLYGLYQGRKKMAQESNCYLVEGYTDVISFHQSGIENVVASSGTSLTTDQIRLIKRYTENITVLFDGDAAGIKASFRGIDMILEEGMNVKVIAFPEGEDPDSYAKNHSSSELEAFLKTEAQDFIRFKTGLLLAETENDPIKRAALIREIVNSIALIPDPIARSVYVQECSRLMEIDESSLLSELNKIRKKRLQKKVGADPKPPPEIEVPLPETQDKVAASGIDYQEKDVIRLLVNFGNHLIDIPIESEGKEELFLQRTVAEQIVLDVYGDDIRLENPTYDEVFGYYIKAVEEEREIESKSLIHHENETIRNLVIDLLSEPYALSPNWEEKHHIPTTTEDQVLKKSVFHAIFSLKLEKVNKMILDNQEELKQANAEEEAMIALLQQQMYLHAAKKSLAAELGRIILK